MSGAQFLYGWLVVVGLIALAMVIPALRGSTHWRTTGRLVSTLLVLAGLDLASGGRWAHPPPLPPLVRVGLVLIDVGLTGYVLFLPERGLLQLTAGWWHRWHSRG